MVVTLNTMFLPSLGCSMYKAMHVVLYTNPFLFQYADRLSKFQNKLTLVKILSRNP